MLSPRPHDEVLLKHMVWEVGGTAIASCRQLNEFFETLDEQHGSASLGAMPGHPKQEDRLEPVE